jgi:antitoxin Phd
MAEKVPNVWTLQDAKNRFSEVVRAAIEIGPQTVTRHGREAVVIVDAQEYGRTHGKEQTLYDFLRNSPLVGSGIDLTRQKDEMREVELPDLPDL